MPRLHNRDLEGSVGQLLWIGFDGFRFSRALESLLKRVRPGGVILFGRNIGTARQVRALTDALYRALPFPPFIALDQEGGRVNRLRPILGPAPSAHDLGHRRDAAAAVRRFAEATALALRSLGFNVNFTPVLDLSRPSMRNGIGDRSFGLDPLLVARLAGSVARAHLRAGVLPVGKHFPGLGGGTVDSHLALPVIRRSRHLMSRRDLLPFRRLRRTLPMVMLGHAYYPSLQGRRRQPASLAPTIVNELLRDEIGFRGLALTDDLEMGALDRTLRAGERALAALDAGSDGMLFCRNEERILEAHDALLGALRRGGARTSAMRASLRRIERVKRRYLVGGRGRFAAGALARSRSILGELGGDSGPAFDPTARP